MEIDFASKAMYGKSHEISAINHTVQNISLMGDDDKRFSQLKELVSFENDVLGMMGAQKVAGKMLKKIKAPGALPKEEKDQDKIIGKSYS